MGDLGDVDAPWQERAKLYLEVESLTDIPQFYWFTDAVDRMDVPVGRPSNFVPGKRRVTACGLG